MRLSPPEGAIQSEWLIVLKLQSGRLLLVLPPVRLLRLAVEKFEPGMLLPMMAKIMPVHQERAYGILDEEENIVAVWNIGHLWSWFQND